MDRLEEILAILRELREDIRQRFNADVVGIFGSYARGEAKKRSDLDVLVRFLEGASLFDLVALADYLEERLGVKVDIVSERAIRPELRDRIQNEVVRV